MENARYVGRVGALAVAMGIGAGALALSGAAWATPSEPDSSSTASSAKQSEKTSNSSEESRRSSGADADSSGDADADDSSGDVDHRASTPDDDDADEAASTKSRKSASSKPSASSDTAASTTKTSDKGTDTTADAPEVASEPEPPTEAPASVWHRIFSPQPVPRSVDDPAAPTEPSPWWAALALGHRQLGQPRAEITTTGSTDGTTALLDPAAAVGDSTPGKSAGPVIVTSGGTIYQVTYDANPGTNSPRTTHVSIVDADGNVIKTTDPVSGVPLEQARAIVRSDGSLVLTTWRTSSNTTVISIVDSQGVVKRLGAVIGQPSAPLDVAPDGTVFLRTRQFAWSYPGDRLIRVSTADRLRTYQIGRAGGDVAITPDGTAYLSGTSLFGTQSVLAVSLTGSPTRVLLPRSSRLDDVLVGADGRGYLTVERNFFGSVSTRVYTFTGTSRTVRQIVGAPVGLKAVAADGVYQATYDAATGRSYISKITASTIETSDPIDGSVINTITATPDGTVYVSVRNQATQADSVAVVSSDGSVKTVAIPGTIALIARPEGSLAGYDVDPDIDDLGYVAYTAGGATYLAVIKPDGTVDRTVALPDGATVGRPVVFSPDGVPYQVIQTRDAEGRVSSESVITLTNDAVSTPQAGTPLLPNFPPLQFGPDGTAYLATVESGQNPAHHFTGIDPSGATVSTLDVSGLIVPQQLDYVYAQVPLAFGPDGTAYATFIGEDAGVWALTPSGGTQVLDLDLSQGATVDPVVFGADGTGYVSVSEFVGGTWLTTVRTFAPLTVL